MAEVLSSMPVSFLMLLNLIRFNKTQCTLKDNVLKKYAISKSNTFQFVQFSQEQLNLIFYYVGTQKHTDFIHQSDCVCHIVSESGLRRANQHGVDKIQLDANNPQQLQDFCQRSNGIILLNYCKLNSIFIHETSSTKYVRCNTVKWKLLKYLGRASDISV